MGPFIFLIVAGIMIVYHRAVIDLASRFAAVILIALVIGSWWLGDFFLRTTGSIALACTTWCSFFFLPAILCFSLRKEIPMYADDYKGYVLLGLFITLVANLISTRDSAHPLDFLVVWANIALIVVYWRVCQKTVQENQKTDEEKEKTDEEEFMEEEEWTDEEMTDEERMNEKGTGEEEKTDDEDRP